MLRLWVFQIATVFTWSIAAQATVWSREFSYLHPPKEDFLLRFQRVARMHRPSLATRLGTYLPSSAEGPQRGPAGSRFAVRTAQKLVEEEFINHSPIGDTTRAIDRNFKGEVSVGDANETHHSLDFQLKTAQTRASLRYIGFGETIFSYDLYQQAFHIEMTQDLSGRSSLVLNHMIENEETRDQLSIRWTW
jgi:hypothetical protein